MPVKLETAFESTIGRIKNQQSARSKQAMEVLKWVFLARRPLTVSELRHALSVEIDPSQIRPGNLPLAYDETLDWDNLPSEESLIDWCLGLIIIDQETSTVRLLHKSLHDYMTQLHEDGKIFPNGHTEMAFTCLQYTRFNDDKPYMDATQPKVDDDVKVSRLARFCFLDYATSNFGYHLRDDSHCSTDMIHEFFPDRINLNCISTGLRSKFLSHFYESHLENNADEHEYILANHIHLRLQFAISCGLDKVFTTLLEGPGQIIDCDTKLGGSTMLLQACYVGNESIVRILLKKGVDINLADAASRTPLSWACGQGHDSVVKLFLQEDGIDLNRADNIGTTALTHASQDGQVSVVKLLLQTDGIDIHSTDIFDSSALSSASGKYRETIVQLLREAGAKF